MTETTDTPDAEVRRVEILDYLIQKFGTQDIALRLTTRGGEIFEALPEGSARDTLENALSYEQPVSKDTLRNIVASEEWGWQLERAVLSLTSQRLSQATERSGTTRAGALERFIEQLPRGTRREAIKAEINYIEGSMGICHEEYAELIHLQQMLSRIDGWDATIDERKKLWDEALKYTLYRVEITFEDADGDRVTHQQNVWRQSESTAHNDVLRSWRRQLMRKAGDGGVSPDEITTEPLELYDPPLDPLDDLFEWLARF